MTDSPAFLFYTKDWYLATAEMMPEEKGVYVDLMCYQHKTGSIPTNIKRLARIAGLDEETFSQYWQIIKQHFEKENNRLVNQRLKRTMSDSLTRSITNKVNGWLPRLLEKTELKKHEKAKFYKLFKQEVDYDDFTDLNDVNFEENLKQAVNRLVNYIANANANEDEDEDVNENKEERERRFEIEVWAFNEKDADKYPSSLIEKFLNYWTQCNKGSNKMAFEKQKTFEIVKRLATFIKNNYGNNRENIATGENIINTNQEATFNEKL